MSEAEEKKNHTPTSNTIDSKSEFDWSLKLGYLLIIMVSDALQRSRLKDRCGRRGALEWAVPPTEVDRKLLRVHTSFSLLVDRGILGN